jgi:hypothetical protein
MLGWDMNMIKSGKAAAFTRKLRFYRITIWIKCCCHLEVRYAPFSEKVDSEIPTQTYVPLKFISSIS